jgi:hypothetical protein
MRHALRTSVWPRSSPPVSVLRRPDRGGAWRQTPTPLSDIPSSGRIPVYIFHRISCFAQERHTYFIDKLYPSSKEGYTNRYSNSPGLDLDYEIARLAVVRGILPYADS